MTAPAPPSPLPHLLKVPDMARVLGVSAKRGYELVPELPPGAIVRLGRAIRIREDALRAWIEAGGTTSTP